MVKNNAAGFLTFLTVFIYLTSCGSVKSTELKNEKSIRHLADEKGLTIGTAVAPENLSDSAFVNLITNSCNYLTPENQLKWESVHPGENSWNFEPADRIVDFALLNNMKVRGHTLVWYNQNPGWLAKPGLTKAKAIAILSNHIVTLVGHYKGKLKDWDVVNEPFDDNGVLRNNLWQQLIGPEYIELAFKWAHLADPDARLFLNDYNIEAKSSKAEAYYQLAKKLKEKGVPITGVGWQFHIDGTYMPEWDSIVKNVKRTLALGLEIQITELDVRILGPKPGEAILKQQAAIYQEIAKLYLAFKDKGLSAFIMWGISDKHSWVPQVFPGYCQALIYDDQFRMKPAAEKIKETLLKPAPNALYFDRYETPKSDSSRALPPFRGVITEKAPVLDGKISSGEWDKAIAYPFIYNQLDSKDMRNNQDQKGLYGKWKVMFQGDTIYGLVERKDKQTVVNHKNPWDNDNVEIFFNFDGVWKQYRTVVGSSWQSDLSVNGSAVWNDDKTILEFSVTVPGAKFTGRTIGWNMALSDNDTPDQDLRVSQLYPIVGNNTGWQGKGFGEMVIQNADGKFVPGVNMGEVLPFLGSFADNESVPRIDGQGDESVWKDTVIYPFGYNQNNALDQSCPSEEIIAGDWRLLYNNNKLFGLVNRKGNKLSDSKKDYVEITYYFEGKFVQEKVPVGLDFEASPSVLPKKAAWSKDGKQLEFEIQLSQDNLASKNIRWSIALIHFENGTEYSLYPFCGYNKTDYSGTDLSVNMQKTGFDFANLKLQ